MTEDWLWADVDSIEETKKQAPRDIRSTRERTKWAKQKYQRQLEPHFEKMLNVAIAHLKPKSRKRS